MIPSGLYKKCQPPDGIRLYVWGNVCLLLTTGFAVAAVAVTRPVQVFGVLIRFLVYIFTTVVLRTGLRSGLLFAYAAFVTNSLLSVLPAALVPVFLCHNDYFRKQLP